MQSSQSPVGIPVLSNAKGGEDVKGADVVWSSVDADMFQGWLRYTEIVFDRR
jgi:hypothetical protein